MILLYTKRRTYLRSSKQYAPAHRTVFSSAQQQASEPRRWCSQRIVIGIGEPSSAYTPPKSCTTHLYIYIQAERKNERKKKRKKEIERHIHTMHTCSFFVHSCRYVMRRCSICPPTLLCPPKQNVPLYTLIAKAGSASARSALERKSLLILAMRIFLYVLHRIHTCIHTKHIL